MYNIIATAAEDNVVFSTYCRMKLWYMHMQKQHTSRVFHTERNLSKNLLRPLVVSVVILYSIQTCFICFIKYYFLLSAGESCSQPSNTQQIQETASVFIPASDPSHEVKSITAPLKDMHTVSTLTANCTIKRE